MSNSKNEAVIHFNDGNQLYKINLFQEAFEQYSKAVEKDPVFYDAYFCIAKTYLRLGDFHKGIEYFKKYVHLVPEHLQSNYYLGLASILISEKKNTYALRLIEDSKITVADNQVFNFASILLSNQRYYETIHLILNSKNKNEAISNYHKLLESDNLSKDQLVKLKDDNIIPIFYEQVGIVNILSNSNIQNNEVLQKAAEAKEILTLIRKHKRTDYIIELNKVSAKTTESQNALYEQLKTLIKINPLGAIVKIYLKTLKALNYDIEKLNPLVRTITKNEKTKTNKILKIASISIIVLVVLSTTGYFGYKIYEKSNARDYALNTGNIESYTFFLNKYGDDDEIHLLRENKIYKTAIENHTSQAMMKFSDLYPNSEHLAKITISPYTNNTIIKVFGINTPDIQITNNIKSEYKVPKMCKIGYTIISQDKLPVTKYLLVSGNMDISEKLYPAENLLLIDNFENNANNWDLKTEMTNFTTISNSVKRKIAIHDNKLELHNNTRDNIFLYSLINVPDFSTNNDFEISFNLKTTKYSSEGTYLLFGASNRAFLFFGYSGNANDGNYNIGNNNWDDPNNKWKNWTNGWERFFNSNYSAYLTIKKISDKLYYYINGEKVKEFPVSNFYGSYIGFGANQATHSFISNLSVKKLNTEPKTNFQKGKIYYCWVDELNVRSNFEIENNILTTIKLGDPVEYLGESSPKEIKATFKGINSSDFFYKVKLLDGTVGWVHGGALKAIDSKQPVYLKDFTVQ